MQEFEIRQLFGSMTFYVTAIIGLVSLGYLLRVYYLRRQHPAMKIITNTSALIILASYQVTFLVALSYSKYVFDRTLVDEQTIFAIAYLLYFGLWIMGNNYFLNHTARIPEKRLVQFKIVRRLLNLELLVLGVLGMITSSIIPFFDWNPNIPKNDFVELIFVISSQLAMITFIYFYKALSNEKSNNASKLIKARIQLMQYAILMQIIMSLIIAVAAGLLFADIFIDQIVEFFLFTVIAIIGIVTNWIVFSSINIPNRIRVRFNIAPNRFKFILANTK